MSSQGATRKRSAPGTAPAAHNIAPNYGAANPGSQLSNDQFLQWGQNTSPNAINTSSYADPSTYNPAGYAASQELAGSGTPSTQLTRRQQPNQLVTRNRAYEQPPATYPDQNNTAGSGDSGVWGESLEELYQRAMAAKQDAQAKRKQIPPLRTEAEQVCFLDESKNTDLIRWSDDGNSFIVLDEDEFARTLIPELFKHNNYASFVRQLNIRRMPRATGAKEAKADLEIKTEDAEENEVDDFGDDNATMPRETRARPQQLSLSADTPMQKDQLAGVYRELQAIRQQQQVISTTITRLRKEHEQLYAQAANFQEQHSRHENSINAILTFLATVYNRSLQGQEGPQNIANSFAGAISGDQGGIVDVDDFSLSSMAGLSSPTGQRGMKKQPLLLKAPPRTDETRATTLSPSAGGVPYETRSRGHTRPPGTHNPGHVEENPDQNDENFLQQDIMSVIQNSNARNGIPTNFSEFPNVLSSLETSGGNVPLTPNQRADMLRLMANETNPSDPGNGDSSNNALITPNPPPMPQNYSGRLASTRNEIDNLVKMQAEQDRSVQNLTNLLQPLSPTGAIPGLDQDGNVPPPPLDLDQIFNDEYFTDLGDPNDDKKYSTQGHDPSTYPPDPHAQVNDDTENLFDFDHIPDDGDLFNSNQGSDNAAYNYGYENSGYGGEVETPNNRSGRVVEQLTDSEATSPATILEEKTGDAPEDGGSAKRRRKA
ncbi:hypothetical protein N7468_007816 [Penicillium chermesinum]|uniref:HSF-type DNA-binding domain-containing protein n=1 Tax=Penicillium chermesinum TaxID=63820 RepID=A0A9W9NNK9_9EURO|nr:uncharacterized protein N7468_007816 [Penicillium chermesinum]KAJ5223274.1 hypothetical protein N7468_007816 [Penicillium chermesinum]